MGNIVAILGNKGGTGKTTLSHLVAHGFGLFNMNAVALLTDTWRDRLSKLGRSYLPFDARSPEQLARAATRLASVPGWYGVIDGGGNRPEMDEHLAELAHVVLLPFRDSHEDLRTVRRDLERFPNAWALPSQWPTNRFAEANAQRSMNQLLGAHSQRILAPVYSLSASKLLLVDQLPLPLPRQVNNLAREVALQCMELLGIEAPHSQWLSADAAAMLEAGTQRPGALSVRA